MRPLKSCKHPHQRYIHTVNAMLLVNVQSGPVLQSRKVGLCASCLLDKNNKPHKKEHLANCDGGPCWSLSVAVEQEEIWWPPPSHLA